MLKGLLVDGLRLSQRAILPSRCLLCRLNGSEGRDLCDACANDIARNSLCCPRCALPLTARAPLCGECLQREPAFASAFVPFVYGHPIDLLLTRFKFSRNLAAGSVLAKLWLDAYSAGCADLPEAIVPVPLHRSRLRERGFNQALEIARPVSKAFGIAVRTDLLTRTRATSAQSDLDAVARRRNLRGAFEMTKAAECPSHVALVDDVMTTGTTVRECARVLRKAGVSRVDVWAIARAPK
ncbi:MAG TPA: ComF family protein [Rudaea sp.]|nr:ComF family protein [Rudaea sp.]